MWKEISIDGYRIQMKVFEEGSEWGIDGGRISKLWAAKDGRCVCNYDRGWDVKPTAEFQATYERIIAEYNGGDKK